MVTAVSANMNVADYCAAMGRNEITVNRDYQRSDKVWPESAKSYLIESIILGYPIPKFYLHTVADPKNRTTIKEIVDGQQRSRAIQEFLKDGFALSNSLDTVELRGLKYSSLGDYQGNFLSYPLSIDQFIGATSSEVRQVFRRMNSYTVPLNPEELRHAENQGAFKWFVSRIGAEFAENLLTLGVFRDKDIVRMQDLKLFTEILHALEYGVTTTARKSLDKLYRDFDASFPAEAERQTQMLSAFAAITQMSFIKGSNLAKPYQVYSLAIALIMELDAGRATNPGAQLTLNMAALEDKLMALSAALDADIATLTDASEKSFAEGSADRTNVKDQRNKRIEAFRAAIAASK
ncbi:MAG: DUF262 domain-containing protein [Pseudomonadota bacterium]